MSASAKFALVLACTLALAACQSSEERAEGHYQSALALIAEGDVDRAMVELRNVFDLNGSHLEARTLFADTLLEQGRSQDAYGQYLRLAEQYPDDLNARLNLTRIATESRNWDEVRRHGAVAMELAPDLPEVQVIAVTIDYAAALEDGGAEDIDAVLERAAALVETQPDALQLRRILVDGALRDNDLDAALAQIEEALAQGAGERSLYDTRISLLAQMGRTEELEDNLREMVALFPEDATIVSNLIRFFISRDEIDKAETFLRERIEGTTGTEATTKTIDLVLFLLSQRSGEAAVAELDRAIAESDDPDAYRSLRARLLFDRNRRDEAIAEMEDLLDGAEENLATNENRVILARMLDTTGNLVGAQRLVAQVLEADSTQVAALKLDAGWKIAADESDAAISLLRTALDQAPQDVEALTLMAEAHLRNGNRDLARDMLSLAVQASNSSAEEARRYAALLIEDERFLLAEEVLIDALRLAPRNLALLVDLGSVYIRMEDWARTAQVEDQLRRFGTSDADRAADGIQAARLSSEGRTEETIAFLEQLASENDGDVAAQVAVVRARLANNDTAGALAYAEQAQTEAPEDVAVALIYAATLSAAGMAEEAEAQYRTILERNDRIENVWIGLIRSLYSQGEIERAEEALAEGRDAMPEALNLLWAQASFLERSGDTDGALSIYEALYERAPNSMIVANNYASLLSTVRDDAESLERAYAVARRLRNASQAPFRDTYGWIAYRRGDYEAALRHLEPAATGLPNNAMVQYHLGETYLALGREDDALRQFETALSLAGEDETRPQFERARAHIADLTAEPSEEDGSATAPEASE